MRLICAGIIGLLALAPRAEGCELALVLANDVSRSVDAPEFDLIRHGTAQALRAPEVAGLFASLQGGAWITLTQWSGAAQNRQMIPWRHITDATSARALADEIDFMPRHFRFGLTAPGNALAFADDLMRQLGRDCHRTVIDISGDGIANSGAMTAEVADLLAAKGRTINGLVVRGDTPDPVNFYENDIRRGPASFLTIAKDYSDFPRAILRKLLREISPRLSMVRR